jgi:hypothetical protein
MGEDEHFVALIHLGHGTGDPKPKDRDPVESYTTFLP